MPSREQHFFPKMRVFFPKFVTINNVRLTALNWLVVIVTMGIAIYQFVGGKRYEIKKWPEGEVTMCSNLCPPKMPSPSNFSYCSAPTSFDAPYLDIRCPTMCSAISTPATGICLGSIDLVQYSPSTAFIPTFYRESIILAPTSTVGSCSTTIANGQVCAEVNNYWVPGVEDQTFEFTHKFIVAKPTSTIFADRPDMKGSSLMGLTTMLLKSDGDMRKIFISGQKIRFTVRELLEYAGIDEIGGRDNDRSVSLDEAYTREKWVDGAAAPTPRLTGVEITLELFYTNEGFCQLTLEHKKVTPDGDHPKLACLHIKAKRQWTQVDKTDVWDIDGSSVSRTYHGISIDFHIRGSFKFLDWGMLFRGVTILLIWLSIPPMILYFFCIIFLGRLSVIYSRVIHQELSLSSACVGLAGRLISHTSAFQDVQDSPLGLTKKRLHERFKMIMQFSNELDDNEVQKFVDFVYEGVAVAAVDGPDGRMTMAEMAEEAELIDVQDFVTVCASNEPLSFDSLVEIFDKDRPLTTTENIFVDDVIGQARSSFANEAMKERVQHAMVRTEAADRRSQLGEVGSAGGSFSTDFLNDRCDRMDDEITAVQQECNRIIEKQKSVVTNIRIFEDKLRRLRGTPLSQDEPGDTTI